jgi:hypothetical protein
MFGALRRAGVGLTIAALATTIQYGAGKSMTTVFAQDASPASTDEVTCFEKYMPAPIDENGIECDGAPGDTVVWKSYTYASDNLGYYMEIDNAGGTPYVVRVGYVHQDGRVAFSRMVCVSAGCQVNYSNGVPFPYDPTGQS